MSQQVFAYHIDEAATPPQRRKLQALSRRIQRQLGQMPWITKHLFGEAGFTVRVGGNRPHELRGVYRGLTSCQLEKTFHYDGATYSYFQVR